MPDLGELIERFLRWLEPFYLTYGYLVVVLGALFEHTFFLAWALPGGILVAIGGIYAESGALELPLVILFATAGFIIGDHLDFFVGRRSKNILQRMTKGKTPGPSAIWRPRAIPALVLAYTNTVPRSAIFMGGAASGLPYRRFIALSASLALLWSTINSLLGYWLGSNRERLQRTLTTIGVGGQVILLTVVAGLLIFYFLRRRRRRNEETAQP